MASFNLYIKEYIFFKIKIFFYVFIEIKVTVDVENNKSQSQEIRTLAKFEFSVKNIILELFNEGPDEVIKLLYLFTFNLCLLLCINNYKKKMF